MHIYIYKYVYMYVHAYYVYIHIFIYTHICVYTAGRAAMPRTTGVHADRDASSHCNAQRRKRRVRTSRWGGAANFWDRGFPVLFVDSTALGCDKHACCGECGCATLSYSCSFLCDACHVGGQRTLRVVACKAQAR